MRLTRHDNQTQKNLTVNDLTDKTKEIIYEIYKKDFKCFGYKK